MTTDPTPDTEISLTFDNQRAVVSPWDASLRRYYLVATDASVLPLSMRPKPRFLA